jgi:hypothetical protein
VAKAKNQKNKFLNLIMTHKQELFYCLQCELIDCCTLASINPDLLCLIASVFLQFNALKVLSARIFKRLEFGCGDSLRGVAILTKIFQSEAITSYLLSITLGVH